MQVVFHFLFIPSDFQNKKALNFASSVGFCSGKKISSCKMNEYNRERRPSTRTLESSKFVASTYSLHITKFHLSVAFVLPFSVDESDSLANPVRSKIFLFIIQCVPSDESHYESLF